MPVSLLDGEDYEDTEPRPSIILSVKPGEKISSRGEMDWRYWALFYDASKEEYYVAKTEDRPPGSACIVSYFAGGKFSALDKGKDFVGRHAARIAADKKTSKKGK